MPLFTATGNRSTLETEAKLKALIFGNADSNPSSGTASPGFSSPLSMYHFKLLILLLGQIKKCVFRVSLPNFPGET